jgi:F-type H+-transporting ATPase subunit b
VESARILAQARTEAEAILTATRSDATKFREELKQQARTDAAAIVKNAEKQVELEKTRAIQEIRQEAVNLSVTIASKLLQRNVSKDDNLRLIEDTFKQIEATERPS